jgi:predicted DsbA family dithiol-disulfide isomerase
MRWIQSIHPMAAKLGLKMRMPTIATRTRIAHETAAWARANGHADAMNDAIFRAWFERGLDIGNSDVLADLAGGLGLDRNDLTQSLTDHIYLPEVLADEQQAQNYGLNGVPAFISNGHGLVGVQTEKSLEQLLAQTV